MQPLIVQALTDGSLGKDRLVNAARVQAALQWFFYVSAIKEATTCADVAKDCDSSWAYLSGGSQRGTPSGLAAEINAIAPATFDRAFDGVLAVRCWRDIDTASPAADLELRDRAISQLDVATLRGVTILVRQRFARLACATGDHQRAALEALQILVPLLDRDLRDRGLSTTADFLDVEIAKSAADIDVAAVLTALDDAYPCP
ncbi:MAG: hypothetical protein R3C68_12760 [Myxococcota bacterium]